MLSSFSLLAGARRVGCGGQGLLSSCHARFAAPKRVFSAQGAHSTGSKATVSGSGGGVTSGSPAAASASGSSAEAAVRPAVAPRSRPAVAPRSGRGKSSSGSSSAARGSKPFRVASLALFAPSLLAAYLCKWQLDRKAWKERVLSERAEKLLEAPVPLFEASEFPAYGERVEVTGTFDDSRSVFLGPRSRAAAGGSERGYYVITPLRDPTTGRQVLVNRGFVPTAWKDAFDATGKLPDEGQAAGAVAAASAGAAAGEGAPAEVVPSRLSDANGTGGSSAANASATVAPPPPSRFSRALNLFRRSSSSSSSPSSPSSSPSSPVVSLTAILSEGENPGNFVPDNAPETGAWFWAEPAALARHAGLPAATPYLQAVTSSKEEHRAPSAMELLGGRARTLPRATYPDPPSLGDVVTTTVSPDDHRNYAITWGSLSLATALLALKVVRKG